MVALLLGLFLLEIALGTTSFSFSQIIKAIFEPDSHTLSKIVWQFRMPKAITCVIAGGSLSVGGLMMQTLFRNPLAGPDVLGLSSGSSLMVAIVILGGQTVTAGLGSVFLGPWTLVVASSIGSSLVFLLVISVARMVKDNTSLLIIGLMLSAATSSIVGVLQFVSRADDLQTFMIWSLGSVGSANWSEIQVLAVATGLGTLLSIVSIKALNGLLLGENYAQSLGLNLRQSRLIIVASAGIFTGAVTAFCGPIAFVGLAVPHLIRLMFGSSDHRVLIPATFLGGACLLLLCDLLAHASGNAQVLPLNAVTAIIGAPIVIWLVVKYKYVRL